MFVSLSSCSRTASMSHASRATKEGSLMVRLLFTVLFALAVDASASGARPQEATVKLAAIPIDTTPKSVAGIVVDEAGQPIAGVRVEARTPVTGFHSSFSVPTGGDSFKPPRVAVTDARGR